MYRRLARLQVVAVEEVKGTGGGVVNIAHHLAGVFLRVSNFFVDFNTYLASFNDF